MTPSPIRVAVINDYEVVVRGVAAMLAPYRNRVEVVETDAQGTPTVPADIALFDTFAGRRHSLSRAAKMIGEGLVRHVVLYTWDAAPLFLEEAARYGVSGVVLKTRSSESLVESLERIARGERVGLDSSANGRLTPPPVELSSRESEVLALIAKGLTNAEMADELYLSSETVKTYVKRLYAKLGVHNRAQAAVAASEYQLAPHR